MVVAISHLLLLNLRRQGLLCRLAGAPFVVVLPGTVESRNRPAKSSTQPCKAKTWCALKFKWAPVLAF